MLHIIAKTKIYRFPTRNRILLHLPLVNTDDCGEMCCVYALRFCYDGTKTHYQVCPVITISVIQCDNTTAVLPPGNHWVSDCIDACSIPGRYVGPPIE